MNQIIKTPSEGDVLARYERLRQLPLDLLLKTQVKVIAIPIPPTPVRGLLYDPGCYESSLYDNIFERDASGGSYKCIAVKDTNMGPVFYVQMDLGRLITLTYISGINRYSVRVSSTAFCAHIEYDHARTKPDATQGRIIDHYANNVRLLSMRLISRSCHGGSHLVIPECPTLTALVQHESAPGDSFFDLEKMPGRVAARYVRPFSNEIDGLFPANWDTNKAIELFLQECFVGHWQKSFDSDSVKVFSHKSCIGNWAKPYLNNLTRNILYPKLEGESNGSAIVQRRTTIYTSEADSMYSASEVRHSVADSLSLNSG